MTAEQENGRLREGLRRLRNQDYDSGYTAESYADAILSGFEPSGEASIPVEQTPLHQHHRKHADDTHCAACGVRLMPNIGP